LVSVDALSIANSPVNNDSVISFSNLLTFYFSFNYKVIKNIDLIGAKSEVEMASQNNQNQSMIGNLFTKMCKPAYSARLTEIIQSK